MIQTNCYDLDEEGISLLCHNAKIKRKCPNCGFNHLHYDAALESPYCENCHSDWSAK
jgi:uncharacterized protein (DUF983 family)